MVSTCQRIYIYYLCPNSSNQKTLKQEDDFQNHIKTLKSLMSMKHNNCADLGLSQSILFSPGFLMASPGFSQFSSWVLLVSSNFSWFPLVSLMVYPMVSPVYSCLQLNFSCLQLNFSWFLLVSLVYTYMFTPFTPVYNCSFSCFLLVSSCFLLLSSLFLFVSPGFPMVIHGYSWFLSWFLHVYNWISPLYFQVGSQSLLLYIETN